MADNAQFPSSVFKAYDIRGTVPDPVSYTHLDVYKRQPYMRKLWDEREQKSRAVVEKAGSQIVEVDKASFQAAMKPVYDLSLIHI